MSTAAYRLAPEPAPPTSAPMPWGTSILLGAGTFVIGAVAPLYDSYVPALLQRHVSSSAGIGAAMGIDNVLALCLVPVIGALSDATRTRLGRRVPYLLVALPVSALTLALLPFAARLGLLLLLATMILLDVALAVWRAPYTALLAELVPSQHRSKTEGIMGVTMCLGAMMVLGTARSLSERNAALPFILSAALVTAVWLLYVVALREPRHDMHGEPSDTGHVAVAPFRALRDALMAQRGAARFFAACLCFHMAFQSFSAWFTLHGSERFHTTVADVSLGFIAVAISTLIGSVPAGWLGARYGRRRMAMIGVAGMAVACAIMHVVPSLRIAVGVLFLFGLSWSLPVANLTPMALELGTAARAGSLAGAFLLVQSAAGLLGPSIVGTWFDVSGTRRTLFLLIAFFLAGALALLSTLPARFGEAARTHSFTAR